MDASRYLERSAGSIQDWNLAYEKVENYLRAHRVDSRIHRAQLIQQVLQTVATRLTPYKPVSSGIIETLAVEECHRRMSDWFRKLLPVNTVPDGNEDLLETQARLALLVSDSGIRWPYAFMETEDIPEEMMKAIRVSSVRAGPDLSVSRMVPRDIDMGMLPELAGETIATFARWPFLKMVFAWTVYLLILAALFFLTR